MAYLAHLTEDREQTVKEHLMGTAKLAAEFAGQFGCSDWGYCCGMLHDIGKYSEAFQSHLRNKDNKKVDHSTAGAQVCEEIGGAYRYMEACIAGHHAGLPDYGGTGSMSDEASLHGRLLKHIEDFSPYKSEIEIPKVETAPFDPCCVKDSGFSLSVFIRMIFSCLVDADYLDTEKFMTAGQVDRDSGESIDLLYDKLMDHISGWLSCYDDKTINGRRSEILRSCLDKANTQRGLFRLTVPTGGGKTMASLSFALRHAKENHMNRVIYVIPYTGIIEQNAKVFKEKLGEENVLEDHYNADYKTSEELTSMYRASENWDKPVVVTTNVQFFESLFSNKPSKCRKLHNIANSVIVFDEAQMLPTDYLKPCIYMMEELIRTYRASIVLCTATQPALQQFFSPDMEAVELCPRMEDQFDFFKRTEFDDDGFITEEELVTRLNKENQALCIVNTRKRAQSLYNKVDSDGSYHLSTCMYPEHRRRALDEIRMRLKEGKRCVVISTSLVEAGVDLDFETVYRQLAGVDSILQAAGRCNREGKRALADSRVRIFRFRDDERIPGQMQQIETTSVLLKEGIDISLQEGVKDYFTRLYKLIDRTLDKKEILDKFHKYPYFEFSSAAGDFKLIEQNTYTVFVAKTEEAKSLLCRMKNQEFSKSLMRKAGQYCVQVHENILNQLYNSGKAEQLSAEIQDLYVLLDETWYTEKVGLKMDDISGIPVFL